MTRYSVLQIGIDPELIEEPLVFSNGTLVTMSPNDKASHPYMNFTQIFLF